MPAGDNESWTVDKKFGRWIRALVDVGAAGFELYRGRQRFVSSAAQDVLERELLRITLQLPQATASAVLKAAGVVASQSATLLEYQEGEARGPEPTG